MVDMRHVDLIITMESSFPFFNEPRKYFRSVPIRDGANWETYSLHKCFRFFRSQVKALTADLALANQDKARHEEALENLRQG